MTFSNAAFRAFKDHFDQVCFFFLLYRLGQDWKKLNSAAKMEKKCCHSVSILKSIEFCHFLKDISKKVIIPNTFDTIDQASSVWWCDFSHQWSRVNIFIVYWFHFGPSSVFGNVKILERLECSSILDWIGSFLHVCLNAVDTKHMLLCTGMFLTGIWCH